MLSFELSVIDIVLLIAVIVLLLLYISRTPTNYPAEPKISRGERCPKESRKNAVRSKTSRRKKSSYAYSLEGSVECPHHFGYLEKLPLGSTIPEDCYSCSRMMRCLFSRE